MLVEDDTILLSLSNDQLILVSSSETKVWGRLGYFINPKICEKQKEFSICDCRYVNPDQGPLCDEWRRQAERLFGETTNEEKMAKIEALRSKLAQSNPQLLVDLPGPDNGDMFLLR